MTPAFVLRASVILTLLSASAAVQAVPTHLSTGQVGIDFDQDTFTFAHDVSSFGGLTTEDISPLLVTVTAVGNGIELNFNDYLSLYATSYTNFSPEYLGGSFNAAFNFTPLAGYAITGYTITYAGTYNVETPGSVGVSGPGGAFSDHVGGGNFSVTGSVAGAAAPSLTGGLSASGEISYVEVFDRYEEVFSHYETVLDYCEVDDPGLCYYTEVPVYNNVAVYRYETDLGEASINLQRITLQANVVAVPEPEGLALLAMGVPMAVWLARRRRRA